MSSSTNIAGGKSQQFSISEIDTIFDFYKPDPPLSDFIDNFWLYEGRASGRPSERILPTGTLELAINLRENELGFFDAARSKDHQRFSGAVVSGAHSTGIVPKPADQIYIIGVHFKPGGAFPFLGLPADEIADTHVDLETLWGPAAGLVREKICEARSHAERFHLLEAALSRRLRNGVEQHYAVSAALEMFTKRLVKPTVREAADQLGLSQRRFIEVFRTQVGIRPKLFSRIQRFQQTRALIHRNPAPNWTNLALDLGYFDQSHFIREFVEFSGLSPTDYLSRHQSFAELIRPSKSYNS